MTRQELIKAAKENLAIWKYVPECVKSLIKKVNNEYLIVLDDAGVFVRPIFPFYDNNIYRLSPDYEEPDEPELIECEIDWEYGRYEVNGDLFPIHEIAPFSKDGYGAGYRIAGYKYEDSDILNDVAFLNTTDIEDEDIFKTIYATHVVFKKVKS